MQEGIDRPAHFRGFRVKNFGRISHGGRRLARALNRFPDAANVLGHSVRLPVRSLCDIARDFLRCRALFVDSGCNRRRVTVDLVHGCRNFTDGFHRVLGLGLDR